MIAIHAALCIFRSTVAVGEGGLYRYRHIVYGGWALYPLLLASLAFTNPKSPYISSGTYCVLPVRPFFYRLGLSWIPRYIIFGTILGIYASIYIYAKRKFRDSESGHSGSRVTISANDHASLNDASSPGQLIPLPTAPVLARHGLIRGESEDNINLESRKLSAATTISLPVQPTLIVSNSRKVQVPKADDSSSALRRKHRAVKRQLRFLFIYPLVYMLLWVVPFVNHCLQYSNYFARNPPFILNCFVTVIVALQCAADCLLFSIREKPWRYIAGSQGTFLNSFAFWTHGKEEEHAERLIRFPWRTIKGEGAMVGLGKDKMTAEANVALIRKNNERRALMLEKDEVERKRKDSVMKRGGRQERNWWEQERKLRGHDSIVDSEVENGERSHAVEMQILRPLEKDTSIGTRMELRECL
ncbi:hypothetical protein MMC12_007846 [Toensbergia leucococca]|nr:hypothetical protein [Toensbergia leucococca]